MSDQIKQRIQQAIQQFDQGNLKENGLHLLATLGYQSDRQLELDGRPQTFLSAFAQNGAFRQDKALFAEWQSVELLCQITDAEIRQSNQMILLDSAGKVVDNAIIESYLFMAVALRGEQYTRTQLAHITREVNRLFQMPVMLLFRHGETLTLSIINRRLHKRERDKDVLEKVTLIKDIRIANPHRAHLEILFDLSLAELYRQHNFHNFVELHQAWQKTLDSSELNKRFFKEIADWYFWAVNEVVFPQEAGPDETRQATSVIRLITRLIFVWFLKEKGLVPDELFNRRQLDGLLTWDDPQGSTYYKAILQNLFFATLNQEMNTQAKPDNRKFRAARESGQSHHFMIHNLYRYERYFRDPAAALALFADVPFLNGGLFECLDRRVAGQDVRVDGFSDRTDNPLRVPDELFFGEERLVDLNDTYGTSGKRYTVRPLIETLNRYKFTITENTPIEEEIALDPELLGKVFENLLAAYNPETGTTARKQTGSFYTPREIVNYMVDESLLAYLQTKVAWASSPPNEEGDRQDAYATPGDDRQDAWDTVFFDPLAPVDIYERNLPHWRQEGVTYFVTFRLADAIPQEKLQQLHEEREAWLKKHKEPHTPAQKAEYHRLFSQRVEEWLDAGMGSCLLADPENGRIVAEALLFFDGKRYRLGVWVVMPNHVHLLVTPLAGYKLEDILHSWKSFTANKINKRLGRSGPLWQAESYDRIIRDEAHLRRVEQYITDNPRKAGIEGESGQDAHATPTRSPGFQPDEEESGQDAHATLEERLRHLFAYNEEPHQFSMAETAALITAIDQVKILDPACGSGAFPMGILHKLVFILGKLDPHNVQWKERQIEPIRQAIKAAAAIPDSRIRNQTIQELEEQITAIEAAFARNELDYGRKLYLIENCIYGVDIQPIAVQIAKLRFFISLVVDQRLDEQASNRGILPLPNLETKFVAANTLLGIAKPPQMALRNPAITEKEKELAEVRSKHFRARTLRTKEKWRAEDKRLRAEIGDLLQQEGNLPNEDVRRLAGWDPYDQNNSAAFFDPEWMFGLESGFDVVIGNPPYVRQEKIKELKPALQKQYRCYTGVADLYVYFIEGGYHLLREQGVLCYICSNKYFRAGYGAKLREFLGRQATIRQLIDFGDAPVFTAIAYPSIIVFQKTAPNGNRLTAFNWEAGPPVTEFGPIFAANRFKMPQSALTGDGWRLEQTEALALLAKLRGAGKPLGEYVNGRFYRGILTGLNEAFVVDRATRDRLIAEHPSSAEILKPFLRGRDVKRWRAEPQDLWLIFTRRGVDINRYPAIKNHLWQYKERLMPKPPKWEGAWPGRKAGSYAWYEVQDNIAYWQEFEQPKIFYPDIYEYQSFAWDANGFFSANTCYFIVTEEKWMVGLLNSNTVEWFYTRISNRIRGGYLRAFSTYMGEIPIPEPTSSQKVVLTDLVMQIQLVKEADPTADVSVLERGIDELVYALYGLTPAEIALVEGREPVRSNRFSGETAEAVTTNVTTNAAPPLIFTGQPPQGSFPERLKRVQSLTKQATPAAIQELVAALADENPTIVWTATAGLRQIGGPQVIGVLQAFMEQVGDTAARAEAEKVLQSLSLR
ncbi:MAG: Eco57I restriction-modification methylase domain-containing protein [Anaerolineae bacterium]|nr:Eco57I restriction-modification methylase domain-containing protein [Anaerolineae bacterium]